MSDIVLITYAGLVSLAMFVIVAVLHYELREFRRDLARVDNELAMVKRHLARTQHWEDNG